MADQNMLPGQGFINETDTKQNLLPGSGFVNETEVVAAGADVRNHIIPAYYRING